MNRTGLWLALALLAGTTCAAQAQSLRCRNDFTQLGDSKASVLLKCGEPLVQDSFCKPVASVEPVAAAGRHTRTGGKATPCETVDEWTYRPGYGQFVTTLRFESGRLAAVRYGERVQ